MRQDDGSILKLTVGEEMLQSTLLELAGKVNTYLDSKANPGAKTSYVCA